MDEFTRAFNVAAAELASTETMRAGFVSDFSHEFRTPINSLSGFAQLLRDDDLTSEERREYAGIIVELHGGVSSGCKARPAREASSKCACRFPWAASPKANSMTGKRRS